MNRWLGFGVFICIATFLGAEDVPLLGASKNEILNRMGKPENVNDSSGVNSYVRGEFVVSFQFSESDQVTEIKIEKPKSEITDDEVVSLISKCVEDPEDEDRIVFVDNFVDVNKQLEDILKDFRTDRIYYLRNSKGFRISFGLAAEQMVRQYHAHLREVEKEYLKWRHGKLENRFSISPPTSKGITLRYSDFEELATEYRELKRRELDPEEKIQEEVKKLPQGGRFYISIRKDDIDLANPKWYVAIVRDMRGSEVRRYYPPSIIPDTPLAGSDMWRGFCSFPVDESDLINGCLVRVVDQIRNDHVDFTVRPITLKDYMETHDID